jgi:hypothetical protein
MHAIEIDSLFKKGKEGEREKHIHAVSARERKIMRGTCFSTAKWSDGQSGKQSELWSLSAVGV